jgi:peptidoglycan/LPS O-acetylase OafA/YrhL
VTNSNSNTAFAIPFFIPQFDGLRGVSILAVFLAHSEFIRGLPNAKILEFGRVGVDLFFVLSGFLITGILLDSRGKPHYFRNFYARRALRIWPLYYAVLAIIYLISRLIPSLRLATNTVWPYFCLYIQNLFPSLLIPYGLEPTWSLAIEEQFYITWPTLVLFVNRHVLSIVLTCLIVLSLALRIVGHESEAPMKFVHNFTLCRLDAIAMGSLSAIWLRSSSCTETRWKLLGMLALIGGALGITLARFFLGNESTTVSYTFIAIAFTGFLAIALVNNSHRSLLYRFLTTSWLRYTGKISYGLYLLHMPIFLFIRDVSVTLKSLTHSQVLYNLIGGSVQFFFAFVLASVSWYFFEAPILRLKEFFPSGSSMYRD